MKKKKCVHVIPAGGDGKWAVARFSAIGKWESTGYFDSEKEARNHARKLRKYGCDV